MVAGLFLPEWVATSKDYSDQNIIGIIEKESTKLPTIIPIDSMSMIERISLLKDYPQNVNQVTVETGTNFDLSSAKEKFLEEITELSKHEILPRINLEDKEQLKLVANLYIQKDEPFISGVFWTITWEQDGFLGEFYMDDQNGKIIQLIVTTPDHSLAADQNIIGSWSTYLGLEVRNIESQSGTGSILEEEAAKVLELGYFELGLEGEFLPYTFYTYENGYGIWLYNEFYIQLR